MQKLFVLGNNYFPELSRLYELRHATQADMAEVAGVFCDIKDYFRKTDFAPDLLFITDESLPPLYCGLEKLDIPLVGYLVDSHLHSYWHKYFAHVFDHCFVAQKNHFLDFSNDSTACTLLPLFAPDDLLLNFKRDIEVSFVGTLDAQKNPQRVDFIGRFGTHLPLTVAKGSYQEIFNRSRIILNQSVLDDINFRVFEAMACGGMLLTDAIGNGLDELFTDGTHLVLYEKGNVADAVAKASYYLEHENERSRIAARGHLETVSRNTAHFRMLTVHKIFQELLQGHSTRSATRADALRKTYSELARRHTGNVEGIALSDSYLKLAENLKHEQ